MASKKARTEAARLLGKQSVKARRERMGEGEFRRSLSEAGKASAKARWGWEENKEKAND